MRLSKILTIVLINLNDNSVMGYLSSQKNFKSTEVFTKKYN